MLLSICEQEYIITAMDCYYHPKNPLLNFCINPNCALPLCPKCINVHLSQSNTSHQIVSLDQAQASMSEQIETAYAAIHHELKSLRQQYEPSCVLNDYRAMLDKYRKEAIDQVNRHYDYLQRQLMAQVSARYSHHLQNLVVPLQDQLNNLTKAKSGINQRDRSLQTLIVVTSHQNIAAVEDLLSSIKDKKKIFKAQLPRLQDGEGGRLKMTSQRIEVVSDRMPSPSFNSPTFTPLPPPVSTSGPLAGLDRIAELQARLNLLRYD